MPGPIKYGLAIIGIGVILFGLGKWLILKTHWIPISMTIDLSSQNSITQEFKVNTRGRYFLYITVHKDSFSTSAMDVSEFPPSQIKCDMSIAITSGLIQIISDDASYALLAVTRGTNASYLLAVADIDWKGHYTLRMSSRSKPPFLKSGKVTLELRLSDKIHADRMLLSQMLSFIALWFVGPGVLLALPSAVHLVVSKLKSKPGRRDEGDS